MDGASGMLRGHFLVLAVLGFGFAIAASASARSDSAFSARAPGMPQIAAQHPQPHHPRPHRPRLADYGDAPENDELLFTGSACNGLVPNYPSRFASGGPFHTDFTDVWLGDQLNTETAEPDAILPNCDDWIAPPFDADDGCLILDIGPGLGSGWACLPLAGGAVFGPAPLPTPDCHSAVWIFRVSVGPTAPVAPRFANVVYDNAGCAPNGVYGDPALEWVLQNAPVTAAPGTSQLLVTLPVFVETSCGDVPPGPPPPLVCNNGVDDDADGKVDEWGVLPFWSRFTVSRMPIDPGQFLPNGWDGSGPPGGFVFGETEDWLVFGDPEEQPRT